MNKDIKYIHTKIKQVFEVKPTKDLYSPTGHYQSFSDKDLYCTLSISDGIAKISLNKSHEEKFEFVIGVGKKWSKTDIHLLKQLKEALIKRVEQHQVMRIDYYRPTLNAIYE